MKLEKLSNFYKKYQLVITLVISTLLFFISTFWNPAIYIASVYILISYIFSSIENIFAYSFYFMLFSGVIVFYIVMAVGSFLVVFIKYIVEASRGKVKVYKWPLLATTLIVALYSLIHYKINEYGVFQGLLIIALMYLAYVVFCYRDQISIRKLFKSMCAGILVTALLSLILYFVSSAKVFIFDNWDYGFVTVKDKVFLPVGDEYKRLELFSYHPNHLACFCMFLIAYSIYELINSTGSKRELIENIFMFIVGMIVGFLTLSKAFFIIFVIELLYVLAFLVSHYKKKSIKYIVAGVVILAVCCFIFRNQIAIIIYRLLPENGSSSLDDMTTGRVAIWIKFLNEIFSSPVKIVFGEGLFTTDIVDIGPHSIYIALLFRFGIMGLIMLLGLIVLYIKSCDGKLKISFSKTLPIIIFAIYSIQEANIDERFFFLLISLILLFKVCPKDKKEENLSIPDNAQKEIVIDNSNNQQETIKTINVQEN